ncbi:hypothetical protein F66182_2391 [Fusarium sp. NRRL 66182]|nr:hypothetical protein F66182_2391 [Fusarium sp. NRRL 66182]
MPHLSEPGTLGNLTLEEERNLQEAWAHLLRLCGSKDICHEDPNHADDFLGHLEPKSRAEFTKNLWDSILIDHPDTAILRFLRARKWDVGKASVIIGAGESVALKDTLTADEEAFMMQYRSGKSYVRGTDNDNRPIHVVKARLHDSRKQSAEAMETYVLHNIETIRIMAREPNDKVCLIFDLGGFGLRNMDFHVVKFLIQILETRYPETLGIVLVHNAPLVFWGVWSVIKHWLDPVVASKVSFTSGTRGLLKFIPKTNLQRSYGGEDNWEYKYVEPVPSENATMQSQETKAKIEAERQELIEQFNLLTAGWVSLEPQSILGKEKNGERNELIRLLQLNFFKLDSYIRTSTYYHRVGVVNRQGDVDFKAAR